jgi:ubiquinone/menaquinone biosynthesis C-methylase UbiE
VPGSRPLDKPIFQHLFVHSIHSYLGNCHEDLPCRNVPCLLPEEAVTPTPPTSAYDAVAREFDHHRSLPDSAREAIRTAVLGAVCLPRPRVLDLGAGTGRIGRAFVASGDDYVGVDLSLGMLREFAQWRDRVRCPAALVQGNGQRLPFRDAAFDAVLLVQVVGAAQDWRLLVEEARRVLRPTGALVVGHAVAPPAGIDAQMKQRLAMALEELGISSYHMETRGVVQPWLEARARASRRIIAAEWVADRSPAMFLSRQKTGARFSHLAESIQTTALNKLSEWAIAQFGSIDATFSEQHAFELQIFEF